MTIYNNLQIMLDDMTEYIRSTGRAIFVDRNTLYWVTFYNVPFSK